MESKNYTKRPLCYVAGATYKGTGPPKKRLFFSMMKKIMLLAFFYIKN